MKNGFSLFKTRKLNEDLKFDRLELQYDIVIPPIYKLFLKTFDTTYLNVEVFKTNLLNEDAKLSFIKYTANKEVAFISFVFDLRQAFKIYEGYNRFYRNRKLFPVADGGVGGRGILLGTIGEDTDKIFLDTENSERILPLANDIFEFVRGLEEFEIDSKYIYPSIKLNSLYKNWGEDFWRIRGEEVDV